MSCASAAAGATVSAERSSLSVRSGGMVTVAAEVEQAGRCTLTGAGVRAATLVRAQTGLAFSWYVGRARAGRYTLRLRCATGVDRVRVRVRGRRRGVRRLNGGPVSVMRTPLRRVAGVGAAADSPAPAPTTGGVQQAVEQLYVQIRTEQIAVGEGMCTEYVLATREEIFHALVMPLLEQWAEQGFDPAAAPKLPTDARSWERIARQTTGVVVSDRPTPGAVIVLEPEERMRLVDGWSLIAEEPGHLAVVDEVRPDGSFTWSDMNGAGGPGVIWSYEAPPGAADGHTFVSLAGS